MRAAAVASMPVSPAALDARAAPARSTCCAKRGALRARKPNWRIMGVAVTSRPSSPYANCTTDLRHARVHLIARIGVRGKSPLQE